MKDSEGENVFFHDTSSAPTSMACIRSVAGYGCLFPNKQDIDDGNATVADAEQAYIQRKLPEDVNMYLYIPRELWTPKMIESARGISDPVFRLLRPLYGWQRSGALWEKHLEESLITMKTEDERALVNHESIQLQAIETQRMLCESIEGKDGWTPVPGWPQTFIKQGPLKKPIILTVYVDDMVMSGPGHKREWQKVRRLIKTTEPQAIERVLGVNFTITKLDEHKSTIKMDMEKYSEQVIDAYYAVQGAPKLKPRVTYPWYEPSIDEIVQLTNDPQKGVFASCAASLLMKALYLARMVRLDISFTINFLSKYVTRWNILCDKQLCHLYSYLANTVKTALVGTIDQRDIDNLRLEAYPDADLCGTYDTTKSTSGGFLCICGDNGTFLQLDWFSKKQTATAHSTTEAELVALSKILREVLVPQMELWSLLLERRIGGVIFEDNESTIVVAKSGYSPQMRHLNKHHRISLGLVHDFVSHSDIDLTHVVTEEQKGDILTKGLSKQKHEAALKLVRLYGGLCYFP